MQRFCDRSVFAALKFDRVELFPKRWRGQAWSVVHYEAQTGEKYHNYFNFTVFPVSEESRAASSIS